MRTSPGCLLNNTRKARNHLWKVLWGQKSHVRPHTKPSIMLVFSSRHTSRQSLDRPHTWPNYASVPLYYTKSSNQSQVPCPQVEDKKLFTYPPPCSSRDSLSLPKGGWEGESWICLVMLSGRRGVENWPLNLCWWSQSLTAHRPIRNRPMRIKEVWQETSDGQATKAI